MVAISLLAGQAGQSQNHVIEVERLWEDHGGRGIACWAEGRNCAQFALLRLIVKFMRSSYLIILRWDGLMPGSGISVIRYRLQTHRD